MPNEGLKVALEKKGESPLLSPKGKTEKKSPFPCKGGPTLGSLVLVLGKKDGLPLEAKKGPAHGNMPPSSEEGSEPCQTTAKGVTAPIS